MRECFPKEMFKTVIHRNVSVEESPGNRSSVHEHKPHSVGSKDYIALAKEFKERGFK